MCSLNTSTLWDPSPSGSTIDCLSISNKDNDHKRHSYLPLTRDNLLQHSFQQQQQQNPCAKGDLFSKRCYSSQRSSRMKQLSHESLLTGSSSTNKRNSRLTENIVIDMLPLPFPYHNDDIFIPAAESGLNRFDSPSSSACSLSLKYRRVSYPVWWHEYGNHSRRQSEQSSTLHTSSTSTLTYPSSPPTTNTTCKKPFSRRIRSWCHHAWKRLLHPARHGG
ncbi:hypothetical protein O0I10_000259 [Lichtheimia ornata]|uniref:Uncharacterized protein n=1 Tax=Lichtheimia ornata TaxID=688661 RepID=A0AAD7Y525_9FUNG|nr:uncharacterized protein O0I10_000259 [Lichtheimia ornata]KAJ8663983.1 hypothetical protein O0I10_000259 [Lichtheimia ornata]